MGRGTSSIKGSGSGGARAKNPIDLTEEQAEALRQRYESDFDDATKKSIEKYISNTDFDGERHSLSQTMNYLIAEGVDINNATPEDIQRKTGLLLSNTQIEAMKRTNANLDKAMHPLGQDVILQRGAHQGDLRRIFGIDDYTKLSEQELKDRLVGGTFKNKAVMSTSYNVKANPFLGGGSATGGREVVYNIKASAKTPAVFGAKSQTEIILGKGINWRITNVRYTGEDVMPRKTMKTIPQIQIDIETY